MDNTKPYAGRSADRLTALINRANSSAPRTLGVDFTFSTPSAYSDGTPRNTKVTMVRVPGTKYKADAEIHYIRLTLNVLDDLPAGWVKSVEVPQLPFNLHAILDVINDALGLNLEAGEVEDVQYTEQQASYVLPIRDDVSLAWLNSHWAFKARFPGDEIDLNEVVFAQLLSGLTYLQPEARP
jgi:hypothetical protein